MKVLQILNYSAPYRGNFIDSLDMIEKMILQRSKTSIYLLMKQKRSQLLGLIASIKIISMCFT